MSSADFAHVVSVVLTSSVGLFLVLVLVDLLLGVAVAVKAGTFSSDKLPAFLASQFGTQEAKALFGLALTALVANATSPEASRLVLAAISAGALALSGQVGGDIKDKAALLLGGQTVTPPGA